MTCFTRLLVLGVVLSGCSAASHQRFPPCPTEHADCGEGGHCARTAALGLVCVTQPCLSDLECEGDEICFNGCRPAGFVAGGEPCTEYDDCVRGFHCDAHDPVRPTERTCLATCFETGDESCGPLEICGWGGYGCVLPCDPADPATCPAETLCRLGQCMDVEAAADCGLGDTPCSLGLVCEVDTDQCFTPVEHAARNPR
jgi:hypothetical protein